MADRPRPQLVVKLTNDLPIHATELGTLLTSMAGDYGRMHRGRTLAVDSIETGSVICTLIEVVKNGAALAGSAIELISAAKNLKEFVEYLRGWLSGPIEPGVKAPKSAEAIFNAAVRSGSIIDLTYQNEHERLSCSITPQESHRRIEQLRSEQARITERRSRPSDLPLAPLVSGNQLTSFRIGPEHNSPASDEAFMAAIRSANLDTPALERLAMSLMSSGQPQLGQQVWILAHGRTEPPITQ